MSTSAPTPRRSIALVVVAILVSGGLAAVAPTPAAAASVALAAGDPCAPGGNPIVCENSKPGTDPSVWDIAGAGDESIQGFATDISVNLGNRIDFKIDTDASAYTIDIYRTGWYGGDGARLIDSVSPSAQLPQSQPACVTDLTTELFDCGNWAVSASWQVPATAVSGVYVAKLHRADRNDMSHITFIVRDDASSSDLVFQTSDTTWHAYNSYGGASFYQGAGNGRAFKLSYNRPFATRAGVEARDFYFGAEYPMVRFLERNGYDVSYISGVDTDRRGALLLNHKVFLSVGHDEYWSGQQRANVEAARDAGVNLAFFSGNEVYWRTRFENAAAGSPDPYRTLVSYKETWANAKIDPSAEWTGTWRDPRFAPHSAGGGLPENGLTGTLYMSNDTDLPVRVSAEEGKLRIWRNTPLANQPAGAVTSLAAHTVGYESNEDLDNGFRPAGLIRLSTTTGAVPQYLQDYGTTVQPGTTTHHTTLYRAASGALVFSAGSIQWTWGLDQAHDGAGAAADVRMQQATVNLFADMGAAPESLMSGLTPALPSTDTTPPTAAISSPPAGTALTNGTSVTVTGTATDVGGRVAGVEVSTDGGSRWHPAVGTTSWTYTYIQTGQGSVPIKVRAVDDSANLASVPTSRDVTVSCPCSLFGAEIPAIPAANDTSAVELGLRFQSTVDGYVSGVRFYKGVGNDGSHSGSLWDASGRRLASVTFASESGTGWQSATFATPVSVAAATTYIVSYTAPQGHYAVQGNAFTSGGREAAPLRVLGGFGAEVAGVYGSPGSFPVSSYGSANYFVDVLFTTVDETPMTIGDRSPLGGATSVPVGSVVSAVLSKPAQEGSVALSLTAAGGQQVAGTLGYDPETRTARFTPTATLAPSTEYTANVAALDSRGVGIQGDASWSFVTAAADQLDGSRTLSLYDDSSVPGVLEVADPQAVTLGTRFASSVDGTVSAVRFYKGPGNTGVHVGALWAVGGASPLAEGTFTGESTTGWQTLTFATPVSIAKDTEYIVSYRTTVGRYSATLGAFSGTGVQRAPLRTAPDSGAYSYADGYPGSRSSTSYLVDVVFTKAAEPLSVLVQSPAPAEPGAPTTAPVSITFNTAVADGAVLGLAAGTSAVAGTFSMSADRRTLTFTPTSALPTETIFTATAAGLFSTDGAGLAPVSWDFTTASADGCPCTLFGRETPTTTAVTDAAAVELGVSFTPSESGLVTGVRFYKGTGNGGIHTGTLWTAAGQQLRTVTFAGESELGWQTAIFASPYEVEIGSTYVVSYLAPEGRYAATPSYFTAPRTAGPLTAPAEGNGRYRYGGGFPTSTWQQTNYFVDVVFKRAAPSAPVVTAVAPPDGSTGISSDAAVSATLSKVPVTGTPSITLTGPAGAIAGTNEFDPTARTVLFTPDSPLPAGALISATTLLDGVALEGGGWTFTTLLGEAGDVTLWTDQEAPANASWNDTAAVQVGTIFQSTSAGSVTAIRFYKGAANTGAHTVNLWSGAGVLLASAPSVAESASGWQTVPLSSPVLLTPGQTYVAAYHSTTGRYAVTKGELANVRTRGPLSTIAKGGAYVYGTGFPASTSTASYGVDLVFRPSN